MPKKVAVGIDLGTTYSCVGVFQNGRVEIIANDQGSRITPSCVAFTEAERLIGDAAKAQATVNPENTVFEAKRLIGRRYGDATVQKDMKQWPFRIVDDNGAPKIKLSYKKKELILTPEEISSMVLIKMKEVAEAFLGCEVTDAVITVPAYFNDSQREATKDAGIIAGLNVLKIINEPTAAAIAYGIDKKITSQENILVYDLGGGTFDVVIISIDDGVYKVKAVGGDTHLGGGDFDNLLVEHFLDVIKRKHNKDLSINQKALGRLRNACENAKRILSSSLKANVDVACLFDGIDFQTSISRNRFEDLCSDLFKKTVEHVTAVLSDAQLAKGDIQEVILVGGSTRIPKIQQLLQEYFGRKNLNKSIHPDEAVAYGAAVKAAIESGENSIEEMSLLDVIPLSLSVNNPGGTVTTAIKRNTRIPVEHILKRTTVSDFQKIAEFKIYEGERSRCENNTLLGTFLLDNIEIARKGVPNFSLTFDVDDNGILHTSAIDNKTGCQNGITITSNKGRLNKMDISRMIQEAGQYNLDERKQKDRSTIRVNLESYCLRQKLAVETRRLGDRIREDEREKVIDACDDELEWLEDNQGATAEECEQKLMKLQRLCAPITAKLS